jgi:hypothetical protein
MLIKYLTTETISESKRLILRVQDRVELPKAPILGSTAIVGRV